MKNNFNYSVSNIFCLVYKMVGALFAADILKVTIHKVYLARIDEVSKMYKEILSKPFDFSKEETLQLNGDKRIFPYPGQ